MKTEINQNVKYTSLSKGFGITGLVLGILTLLISFIPCFGLFAIIFGIIAIMVSLIGLVIALKHNHEKGLIIGALICSLLGCGIAYSQYAAINSITNEIVKETNIRLLTCTFRCVKFFFWSTLALPQRSFTSTHYVDPKHISNVKPDAIGKIQHAHVLAWFLWLWVDQVNRVTHVYLNRDRDSMPWTHVKSSNAPRL